MFHEFHREPFRRQRLFLYVPTKEVNESGVVPEGRSVHINVDAHFGRQAFGRLADRGEATLIDGCLRLLASDIIKQNVRSFKVCSPRSANQGFHTIDASRSALDLEDRLKANRQLMRIENGFENGLPHALPPANCTTVSPNSFNRIGFRRNASAPDADASALSSGQP